MTEHHNHEPQQGSFWRSRTGIALLVFLATAALLLAYEHRVHLFAGNPGIGLLLAAYVVVHLFMHGGHGGQGNGGGR
ncbi:MAG: hypothetical protein BroJett030_24910 [Alphaproteobacteria bacterium]|nr:MAG: hypothetical protein BroJett030_24910 [Alphaproteobacteria bacterium]